ncbi:entericidin [Pararhizobium sp.]|uniref:entericidin domain-containing protein n=1 Tax=Pararhizobium sp. TaxID=1977563 RepID=UPI0027235121|nr:entericidin [Pararhizobium sp.]MDO9418719.1 entericidin [Pararhizobium sp.]
MNPKIFAKAVIVVAALAALSACGNTIRGVGRDAANTVNATQDAGRSVANSAN